LIRRSLGIGKLKSRADILPIFLYENSGAKFRKNHPPLFGASPLTGRVRDENAQKLPIRALIKGTGGAWLAAITCNQSMQSAAQSLLAAETLNKAFLFLLLSRRAEADWEEEKFDAGLFRTWKRIKSPVAVIVERCVSARRPRSLSGRIVIVQTAGEPPELRQ
jgi:hypothetical protein